VVRRILWIMVDQKHKRTPKKECKVELEHSQIPAMHRVYGIDIMRCRVKTGDTPKLVCLPCVSILVCLPCVYSFCFQCCVTFFLLLLFRFLSLALLLILPPLVDRSVLFISSSPQKNPDTNKKDRTAHTREGSTLI